MASLKTAPATWEEALERIRAAASACVDRDLLRVRIDEPAFSLEVRRTRRVSAAALDETVLSAAGAEAAETHAAGTHGTNGVVHPPAPAVVKADLVGIVRLSKPLISEGSSVIEDRELAYVESLGTRNPIRAAGPGIVRAVFVTDGQPVDFGHPLFSIAYD